LSRFEVHKYAKSYKRNATKTDAAQDNNVTEDEDCCEMCAEILVSAAAVRTPGVEKMVFNLLFFWFKKTTTKSRNVELFGFYGFLDIIFSYKFCAQTIMVIISLL